MLLCGELFPVPLLQAHEEHFALVCWWSDGGAVLRSSWASDTKNDKIRLHKNLDANIFHKSTTKEIEHSPVYGVSSTWGDRQILKLTRCCQRIGKAYLRMAKTGWINPAGRYLFPSIYFRAIVLINAALCNVVLFGLLFCELKSPSMALMRNAIVGEKSGAGIRSGQRAESRNPHGAPRRRVITNPLLRLV